MIVYLLLNQVNAKGYVGQTCKPLHKRWNKQLNNVPTNPYFSAAIKKYGAHSFTRHILARSRSRSALDLLEKTWIARLQTNKPAFGYNIQAGGVKARHTAQTKERLSAAMTQYWQNMTREEREAFAEKIRALWRNRTSEERGAICRKISKALIRLRKTVPPWIKGKPSPNRGKPSPRKGKRFGKQANPYKGEYPPLSEETKRKISEGLKKYWAGKQNGKFSGSDTFHHPRICLLANRSQPRFTSCGKREADMSKDALAKELKREVGDIITCAFEALEKRQSTRYARAQLREVERKLKQLEFEYQGGCSW